MPLTTIAAPAIRALPHASAQTPAITQPIAPLAMATNATSDPFAPGERRQRGDRRRRKRGDPRPHGVELPHVAEVAERGEPHAAIAEHRDRPRADRTVPTR